MIKRYIVFGGYDYYPKGGLYDYLGAADTIEEARQKGRQYYHDWYQIVEHATMKCVVSASLISDVWDES